MLRNFYFTLKINTTNSKKKLKFNYIYKKKTAFLFFDIH
jgi:hypothetical protein